MSRIEGYRQKAEDCRRFAEQSDKPEQKAFWLDAAEEWVKLADLSDAQVRQSSDEPAETKPSYPLRMAR
jgi:hypothetical protein